MTKEVWRDISGYVGLYQVSNLGRVRSLDRIDTLGRHRKGKVLTAKSDKDGYHRVDLFQGGKGKACKVHRLVAQAFLEYPDNLPQINHKDEIKTNNALSNLEWCSSAYNCCYGTRNERSAKAQRKPIYVVTSSGHRYYFDGVKKTARLLGLEEWHMSNCLNGKEKTHRGFSYEWAEQNA